MYELEWRKFFYIFICFCCLFTVTDPKKKGVKRYSIGLSGVGGRDPDTALHSVGELGSF